MPDATLGFITGPSVSYWFMFSVFNLFKDDRGHRFDADMMAVYGPYIHRNRKELQSEFMESGRDWIFMVDNDMFFVPDDVWALFDESKRGPGIYSAPYVLEDGTMDCGPWTTDQPMIYHRMGNLPTEPCDVGMVGAGFTLIHRDVFGALGEDAFSALSPIHGEDVSFCWRAREAGFTPRLVPGSKPGHVKQVVVFPDDRVRNMVGGEVNLVEMDFKQLEEVNTSG